MTTTTLPELTGDDETEFDTFDLEYDDEEEKILDQVFSSLGEFKDDDMEEIEPLGDIPETEDFDE